MKTFFLSLLTTITLSMSACAPAYAGGMSPIIDDPHVYQPQCRILFGLLPCNEGGYVHTIADPAVPTTTPTDGPDKPTDPDDCDPKDNGPKDNDRGPKGNASANNGKGGNYDKTGHSDNGKGNGKGRR